MSPEGSQDGVSIDMRLTVRQAGALAQLMKRLDHKELQSLATSGNEAQLMYEGCYEIRKALGREGFRTK